MRQLVIDIETVPHVAYTWDLWRANIPAAQIIEPSHVICFAAKWVGEPGIFFKSEFHDGREVMVKTAWELLNEADSAIHYNGESFDIPKLNREFQLASLGPPAPYKQVDLLKVARKQFSFASNKLDFVSKELGSGAKLTHEGWPLWAKCIAGDASAWARMRRYNKQDVRITERVYRRLLPWIPGLPSFGAFTGEDVCPACGSGSLVRQGHAFTRTGRYQRYQCADCGHWSRATRRDAGTQITEAA